LFLERKILTSTDLGQGNFFWIEKKLYFEVICSGCQTHILQKINSNTILGCKQGFDLGAVKETTTHLL
jgi:hypothetical protein